MVTLRTSPLEHIRSADHLVLFLGMSVGQLRALSSGMASTSLVKTFTVVRGGKTRRITRATSEQLQNVHRRVLALLTAVSGDLPPHVNGYVRGRSIAMNASAHAGHRYLQKFDFVDFFPHVASQDVAYGLQFYGMERGAAELISELTTVAGRLPVGFSTSPALANVAMCELDRELAEFAARRELALSRYADDLAFSGDDAFDVEADLRVIVRRYGQEINSSKTKTLKYGQPLYVTGLSTSARGVARLPRPMKRSLRQHCYYIEKYGLSSHASVRGAKSEEFQPYLSGLLSYARSVEPDWVERLLNAHSGARAALFPKMAEVAVKRRARLLALADRVRGLEAPRAAEYEPAWTYGDL